ncbi:DUF3240 family protein [Thiomicrorhabdus sp. ZW0627]|uniref:DUF3240 family protein n=1 Tax=Thiomicrorhabdus sp. ZW0627 TaxID=3039774 RepID=UPI002436CC39|nr:DUF3240 family protein [Thiomicrorhabdus sp. ZW0627]MDG6773443.1 DUF3240 family protein [Thiomicrorhabdus sp. ZW0627]
MTMEFKQLQPSDDCSVVLHLILPASQVNDVVDCLLAEKPSLFFSVVDVQGYGQPQERLTVREQVAGYQHKVMVQIECEHFTCRQIMDNIKKEMPTATISYRILPLFDHGQL